MYFCEANIKVNTRTFVLVPEKCIFIYIVIKRPGDVRVSHWGLPTSQNLFPSYIIAVAPIAPSPPKKKFVSTQHILFTVIWCQKYGKGPFR